MIPSQKETLGSQTVSNTQDLIEEIRSELEQVAAHSLAYEKDFYDSIV